MAIDNGKNGRNGGWRKYFKVADTGGQLSPISGQNQFGLPNYKEQQEIVEYLDKQTKDIDDLVSLENKKMELLKEYRQSLISEVITGKIKVSD
jgi:hypothetical protein